jgi:hypothetical protein
VSEIPLVLLVKVTLPITFPAADGVNVTVSMADWPGAMIDPAEMPLALKPGPEIVTFEKVILLVSEFLMVTLRLPVEPTATLPKFKGEGLALSPVELGLMSPPDVDEAEAEVASVVTPTHPDGNIHNDVVSKRIIPGRHMTVQSRQWPLVIATGRSDRFEPGVTNVPTLAWYLDEYVECIAQMRF